MGTPSEEGVKGLLPTVAFSVLTLWKDMALGMWMAWRGFGGCVPSAVSKRQGVDVACVHIVVGPVCRKVRLGGDGRDHAWCLGSRFLLSPYLLLTPRNCYIADVYPQIKSQLIFGRLLRKYHLSPFNLCCSARAVYFLHGFRKSDMRDA